MKRRMKRRVLRKRYGRAHKALSRELIERYRRLRGLTGDPRYALTLARLLLRQEKEEREERLREARELADFEERNRRLAR
jgi:hypothetical protein